MAVEKGLGVFGSVCMWGMWGMCVWMCVWDVGGCVCGDVCVGMCVGGCVWDLCEMCVCVAI